VCIVVKARCGRPLCVAHVCCPVFAYTQNTDGGIQYRGLYCFYARACRIGNINAKQQPSVFSQRRHAISGSRPIHAVKKEAVRIVPSGDGRGFRQRRCRRGRQAPPHPRSVSTGDENDGGPATVARILASLSSLFLLQLQWL